MWHLQCCVYSIAWTAGEMTSVGGAGAGVRAGLRGSSVDVTDESDESL